MTMLDLPSNPVPPDGREISIVTADGVTLRAAIWPRPGGIAGKPGTVLLLQGRAEFIEKYFETVDALRGRGFTVVTFDWRGQGGSDRAIAERSLGHVRHFADYRHDYEAARALITADEDVTVLAHSMGGAIALMGAHEGWLAADRLLCINPMVGLSMVRAEFFAKGLARFLAWAGFGERIVPGGETASISSKPFPGNRLSNDLARYDRNAALAAALDWQAIGSPSIGWLRSAYEAMDSLSRPGIASGIVLPVLNVLSEEDPVCSTPAMKRFAASLPNGDTVVIPGARHEILMETDAIQARFWSAFDAFVGVDDRRDREAAAPAA